MYLDFTGEMAEMAKMTSVNAPHGAGVWTGPKPPGRLLVNPQAVAACRSSFLKYPIMKRLAGCRVLDWLDLASATTPEFG